MISFQSFIILDLGEFGFMGIHAKPDDADAEIDKLVDVYDEVVGLWGLEVRTIEYKTHKIP